MATNEVKKVKVPTDEIKAKLRGFSIARKAVTYKINEAELTEYAPVVSVKTFTNATLREFRDIQSNKELDATVKADSLEQIMFKSVESIKIYDIADDEFVTYDKDTLTYDIYADLPSHIRVSVMNTLFELAGLI